MQASTSPLHDRVDGFKTSSANSGNSRGGGDSSLATRFGEKQRGRPAVVDSSLVATAMVLSLLNRLNCHNESHNPGFCAILGFALDGRSFAFGAVVALALTAAAVLCGRGSPWSRFAVVKCSPWFLSP